NLSTDHARPPVRRALASSRRFPASALLFAALTRRLDDILSGSSGVPVDFATDVRPWLGKEAAFALLNTTTTSAGSLIVLDVRSRPRANAFLTDVAAARYGYYHGVPL